MDEIEVKEADEIIVQDKGKNYSQIIIKSFFKNPFLLIALVGSALILLLFIITAIGMFLK